MICRRPAELAECRGTVRFSLNGGGVGFGGGGRFSLNDDGRRFGRCESTHTDSRCLFTQASHGVLIIDAGRRGAWFNFLSRRERERKRREREMPKGTKVSRCIAKVMRKSGASKAKAIRICQHSTGLSYRTGKSSKKHTHGKSSHRRS